MPKSFAAPAKERKLTMVTSPDNVGTAIPHPLAGEWINGFEDEDDVKIIVTGTVEDFKVQVVGKQDDEKADIYDARWDGESLFYNIYWNSTGRFLRCRLQIVAPKRVAYTYTYTATEMWRRS